MPDDVVRAAEQALRADPSPEHYRALAAARLEADEPAGHFMAWSYDPRRRLALMRHGQRHAAGTVAKGRELRQLDARRSQRQALLPAVLGPELFATLAAGVELRLWMGCVYEARLPGPAQVVHLPVLVRSPAATFTRRLFVPCLGGSLGWYAVVEQLEAWDAPALGVLVVGVDGFEPGDPLPALPASRLRGLEHLHVGGELSIDFVRSLSAATDLVSLVLVLGEGPEEGAWEALEALFAGGWGAGLQHLRLHGPGRGAELLGLAGGLAGRLQVLALAGAVDAAEAEAFVAATTVGQWLLVECLDGAVRSALAERTFAALDVDLPGDDWWMHPDLPAGVGLAVEDTDDGGVLHCRIGGAIEHGRWTRVLPNDAQEDRRYWFGRRHGLQVRPTDGGQVEETWVHGVCVASADRASVVGPPTGARFGFGFQGEDNEALVVLGHQRCTEAEELHGELHPAVLAHWGPYLDTGAHLDDVFALADDGSLDQWLCQVRATGEVVWIVTGHFGDTRAGVVVHDGVAVAEIGDGEVREH